MSRFPAGTLLLAALIGLANIACTPRFYQRTTVALEVGDEEAVQIRYGELDSCLLRRQVPVDYVIRRPRYTLQIRPVPGLETPARLELRLQAGANGTLQFPDLAEAPQALFAELGVRYVVDTAALNGVLNLQVRRGNEELGSERFKLSAGQCRVLSPN